MIKKKYNVLELFAGAGGLALGLEKAGFNTTTLIEIDKNAAKTLKINRSHWNILNEDINVIANEGIKKYIKDSKVDLVSGGFPCQPFSYAGKRLGLNDVRGTLFYDFAKIVNDIKPKMFLAENVKGLVNHDNGKTFKTMIDIFQNLGYVISWRILNAVNYEVPQKRQRLFIVGIKKENYIKEFSFPEPSSKIITVKDALKNVPVSIGAEYNEKKKKIMDLIPPGGYWRDLPVDIAKEYMGKSYYLTGGRTGMARRISWDEPSLTLTCSPSQAQTERCHPKETRPFTIREYARIQTFPDEWQFYGSMNSIYKQIGNAVPVNLAKKMGLEIVKYLNLIESEEKENMNYPLDFIQEEELELHIKNTILKYSKSLNGMNLKKFQTNIVDPIKILFDASVFKKNIETIIESEIIRQKDKTNNNLIGYFHQNLFKYIKNKNWEVLENGFDIINKKEKVYVEMKNKHNTMNSSSAQKTFIEMQSKIIDDSDATCMLVEVIAKKSQNIPWIVSIKGKKISSPKIRKVSIDQFYEIVTGDKYAFYKLCNYLPLVIEKVINNMPEFNMNSKDTVIEELKEMTSKNLIDALYKLSFNTYLGWVK